jgi:hypothetical protein
VAEGLSASEVGKEIAEHRKHAAAHTAGEHSRRDRVITIAEALLLSIVALLAAWSGYSAAKWSTESSISMSKASATRAKSTVAHIQAVQIRTLDSVSFNAVFSAYLAGDRKAFALALKRLRPGYKPAVDAWLKTRPLKNPKAPPDPSYMPQYRIPQQSLAPALDEKATKEFHEGQSAAEHGDDYVRITVFLAAVLFLVGISTQFPLRVARYGLLGLATALLIVSVVQILGLPGPPA